MQTTTAIQQWQAAAERLITAWEDLSTIDRQARNAVLEQTGINLRVWTPEAQSMGRVVASLRENLAHLRELGLAGGGAKDA